MLGFRNDENLFVDENGKWDAKYIPAFVRRYPFVLAEAFEGSKKASEQMLEVRIDETFPGLNHEKGKPLFQ